jgi:DNA-directed RNA polymerase specialized sigma24 family protein
LLVKERRIWLTRALARLPTRQQRVLHLYLLDYSQPQMAVVLGISRAAVNLRLNNALAHLAHRAWVHFQKEHPR